MAYEVIWITLLGLIVGPTTYSFTIVLVTFITGLALGAMFFGWLGDRVRRTLSCSSSRRRSPPALFALLFSQIAGNSQIFFAKLIVQFKDSFASLHLVKALVLFLFMLPPTFCLGATFPLVGKIYTSSLVAHRALDRVRLRRQLRRSGAGIVLRRLSPDPVRRQRGRAAPRDRAAAPYRPRHRLSRVSLSEDAVPEMGARRARRRCLGLALVSRFPHWDRRMLSKGKYHRFDNPEIRRVGWLTALFSGSARFSDRETRRAPLLRRRDRRLHHRSRDRHPGRLELRPLQQRKGRRFLPRRHGDAGALRAFPPSLSSAAG